MVTMLVRLTGVFVKFGKFLGGVGRFLEGLANFINAVAVAFWLYGYDAGVAELEARINALENELSAALTGQNETVPLSAQTEALWSQYQQQMDLQYQVGVLSRYVLTLPAMPEEGY